MRLHRSHFVLVISLVLLAASTTRAAAGEAAAAAASSSQVQVATAAIIDVDADTAPEAGINTFFRRQDNISTSDATEQDIPGLQATDYKKVWRSIPLVDDFAPFITSVVPFLPNMKSVSVGMGYTFPDSWPLAGVSGEHKDWLSHTMQVYLRAMLRQGPRPDVFPTILVPTKAAYKKLAADLKQHSGLPDLASVHDPAKKAVMAAAVYQQLMRNLVVVDTPKLSTAANGQVVMTQGKVKLVLQVKPDGSRYLVSNTTTLKLVAMDLGCDHCSNYLTVQLVDSFVVPAHMSATPIKPDPIFTAEDVKKWPEHLKVVQEGWAAMPAAIAKMPGAAWGMLVRQLPDSHQELLKKLPRVPSNMFSLSFKVQHKP